MARPTMGNRIVRPHKCRFLCPSWDQTKLQKCKQTTIKVAEVRAQKLELVGCIEKLLHFTDLRRCGPKACKPRSPKRAALSKVDRTDQLLCSEFPLRNIQPEIAVYCSLNQQREITAHARAARKTSMPPKVHPIYGCTWGSFIEPFSGTSGGRARRARRALVRATGKVLIVIGKPNGG